MEPVVLPDVREQPDVSVTYYLQQQKQLLTRVVAVPRKCLRQCGEQKRLLLTPMRVSEES